MNDLNLKLPDKKIAFLIVFGAILTFVFFLYLVTSLVGETKFLPKSSKTPTPTTNNTAIPETNLDKDYSKINSIIPGKTTFAQAQQINGKADSIKRTEEKTFLYYNTPIEFKQNIIAVENNLVTYSTENVYGSYRKTVSEYTKEYGVAELKLFDQEDNYPWDVYLSKGVAFKNDGKDVGEILYFLPQTNQQFLSNIAPELKISTDPPTEDN